MPIQMIDPYLILLSYEQKRNYIKPKMKKDILKKRKGMISGHIGISLFSANRST